MLARVLKTGRVIAAGCVMLVGTNAFCIEYSLDTYQADTTVTANGKHSSSVTQSHYVLFGTLAVTNNVGAGVPLIARTQIGGGTWAVGTASTLADGATRTYTAASSSQFLFTIPPTDGTYGGTKSAIVEVYAGTSIGTGQLVASFTHTMSVTITAIGTASGLNPTGIVTTGPFGVNLVGVYSWQASGTHTAVLTEAAPTPQQQIVGDAAMRLYGDGSSVGVVVRCGVEVWRSTTMATSPSAGAGDPSYVNFTYDGPSKAGQTVELLIDGIVMATGIVPSEAGAVEMHLGPVTYGAPTSADGNVDLSGDVESATVDLYDEEGNLVGSGEVDSSGNYSVPLTAGLYGKSLTAKLRTTTKIDGISYPSNTTLGTFTVGSGTTSAGSSEASVGVVNLGGGSSAGGSSAVGAVQTTVDGGTPQQTYSYNLPSGGTTTQSYVGSGSGGSTAADVRHQTAILSSKLDEIRETVGDAGNTAGTAPEADEHGEFSGDTEVMTENVQKLGQILSNFGEIGTKINAVAGAFILQLPSNIGQTTTLSYEFPEPIGTLSVDLTQTPHLDMIRATFALLFIMLGFMGARQVLRNAFAN